MINLSTFRFAMTIIAIGLLAGFAPAERSLGTNVRVVYMHGAWVWVALVAFSASALTGLVGLVTRRESWMRWSQSLGRTGLCFWIAYLPLSLWAMQANWNGLFLAEPRWRIGVVFAAGGLLLQLGLYLVENLTLAAVCNLLYGLSLFGLLRFTENVMHPGSPILDSEATRIQWFFAALLGITLFAAWQVAQWWHSFESPA